MNSTEEKHLRKQLDRSEGRFRLLVQEVKEYAIFMLDLDGHIRSWNDGAERIKGYSEEEILGQHFSIFYTDEEAAAGRPDMGLEEATREGQWNDEGWRVRKDGSRFWARVTITALTDEDGEHFGFAKVTRDMTDRKDHERELTEAYEKLRETERLKDEFFASVSHELRTPLTLILSPVEAMLEEEKEKGGTMPPEHRRRLETVHNNSIRMLQMVNGLLDFSRLDMEEIEVDREPTDIEALTRTICYDFVPLSKRKNLELDFKSTVERPFVNIDQYLYERILFNLLSNAVKFTPKGGEVEVRLSQEELQGEDRLTLAVADTGEGIPEDELETIFKDFRQVDASATRRFEGTGLGLPLVKEFAELMDGTVSVESTLDAGSTFTVDLRAPISDQPQRLEVPQPRHTLAQQFRVGSVPEDADQGMTREGGLETHGQSDSGSGPQLPKEETKQERQGMGDRASKEELSDVVLAEDNDGLSAYIEELLFEVCDVHRARDGVEAEQLIRDVDPALIILDVMMPKKDGIELCRELKANAKTADVPVMMLTALTNRKALIRGWEAGADEYLFKPFHPKELVTRIRTLLRNVERRKEAEESRKKLEQQLLQTSERERRQIGQDLHDGLASHLTGLSTIAQTMMAKGRGDEMLSVDSDRLKRVVELAQEGARQARVLARGLNPVKLDRKGLPAAMQTLAENQELRADISSEYEEEGQLPELSDDDSINLYWIAHEAVHNAIQHGQAEHITIRLLSDGPRVTLEVEDDGEGLSAPVEELEEGMGLSTMRYRADMADASLSITEPEEGGVLVSCTLSVASDGAEETAV